MRTELSNPYTNRGAISRSKQFFGREIEMRDIYTRIRGGQSIMLIGERRIGKSSLLHAVGFEREEYGLEEEFDFVFLDMQSIVGCTEESFIQSLLSLIGRATGVSTGNPSRASLEQVAAEIVQSGRRLIVGLDEFDVLVWNEKISPDFLVALRSWTVRYGFPFVVAFREGSIDRIVEDEKFGSAFLNLFGSVYVGPLKESEAHDLIRKPAQDSGIEFSDDEVEAVLDLAGFFPLFLQIACYHLFEIRKTGRSLNNAVPTLDRRFAFEAAPHFEYMWLRLSVPEQDVLRSWARGGGGKDRIVEEALLMKGVLVQEHRATRLFSSLLPDMIESCDGPKRSWTQSVQFALLG